MATMLVPQKKKGEMRSRNAASWSAGSATASMAFATCCGGCVLLRPAAVQAAGSAGVTAVGNAANVINFQARHELQPHFSSCVRSKAQC